MFGQAPIPWYLAHPALVEALAGNPSARAANTILAHDVYLPAPATLTSFTIVQGNVSAGHLDLGIYDANGNLLAHTGITPAGTPFAANTLTLPHAISLVAGRYLLGFWSDNATDTYFALTGLGAAASNLVTTVQTSPSGLQSFSLLGGSVAGSILLPFQGHLNGTGF